MKPTTKVLALHGRYKIRLPENVDAQKSIAKSQKAFIDQLVKKYITSYEIKGMMICFENTGFLLPPFHKYSRIFAPVSNGWVKWSPTEQMVIISYVLNVQEFFLVYSTSLLLGVFFLCLTAQQVPTLVGLIIIVAWLIVTGAMLAISKIGFNLMIKKCARAIEQGPDSASAK